MTGAYNPDYSAAFATPVCAGPQLTEHTGNRIASALERIADAMEAKKPDMGLSRATIAKTLATWDKAFALNARFEAAYPFGDPAPSAGANGPKGPAT